MVNTAIAGGAGLLLAFFGSIGLTSAAGSTGDGVPQSNLFIYADN